MTLFTNPNFTVLADKPGKTDSK